MQSVECHLVQRFNIFSSDKLLRYWSTYMLHMLPYCLEFCTEKYFSLELRVLQNVGARWNELLR